MDERELFSYTWYISASNSAGSDHGKQLSELEAWDKLHLFTEYVRCIDHWAWRPGQSTSATLSKRPGTFFVTFLHIPKQIFFLLCDCGSMRLNVRWRTSQRGGLIGTSRTTCGTVSLVWNKLHLSCCTSLHGAHPFVHIPLSMAFHIRHLLETKRIKKVAHSQDASRQLAKLAQQSDLVSWGHSARTVASQWRWREDRGNLWQSVFSDLWNLDYQKCFIINTSSKFCHYPQGMFMTRYLRGDTAMFLRVDAGPLLHGCRRSSRRWAENNRLQVLDISHPG